jgi:hypothetical protein
MSQMSYSSLPRSEYLNSNAACQAQLVKMTKEVSENFPIRFQWKEGEEPASTF